MFAKGYTNIRAMIETQYGILSQMITDIAYRYQLQLKDTEEENDILQYIAKETQGERFTFFYKDKFISLLLTNRS